MALPQIDSVSLTNIAHGTGISLSMVSRILSGHRTPSLENATKIAAYLGVSVDEFINALPEAAPIALAS